MLRGIGRGAGLGVGRAVRASGQGGHNASMHQYITRIWTALWDEVTSLIRDEELSSYVFHERARRFFSTLVFNIIRKVLGKGLPHKKTLYVVLFLETAVNWCVQFLNKSIR